MPDLDALAPNYRRAHQRWASAPTLAQGYEALRVCFDTNSHGLVEHVKSFIESVCLTIMGELRTPMPSSAPSTTDLLVAALNPLGLRNTRGASKLDKVLSAFNRLADALTDMRNDHGPVAHGKDAFLDALTIDHTRAFLHTGDAILGVLINALEGKQPDLTATREPYESFPHLNERIDRAVAVEARIDEDGERPMVVFSVRIGPQGDPISLRVEPSRLLYGIDRSAYIEVLRTADLVIAEMAQGDDEDDTVGAAAQVVPTRIDDRVPGTSPAQLVVAYRGPLRIMRRGLSDFLTAEGARHLSASDTRRLVDSLLATIEQNMGLDWRRRESLQAGLRVACKRVLVRFGIDATMAARIAERLVVWLRAQAPEIGDVPLAQTPARRRQE